MQIYSSAPEVKSIGLMAFPSYTGNKFSVDTISGTMRLDSCWSGGSRDYFVLIDMVSGRTIPIPENGTPFSNNGQIFTLDALPLNIALVQHTIACGKDLGITIFVSADNLSRLLPPVAELSREEQIVLVATRSLKSSYNGIANYRFHEANSDTGITLEQWETAKSSCVARGMLNKAGAITNDGRNAAGTRQLWSFKTATQSTSKE